MRNCKGIWSANDGTMPSGMPQFEGKFESGGWAGQTQMGQSPNQGWNEAGQIPVQVQVNGHNDQTWSLNGQMDNNTLAEQAKLWSRSPVVSIPQQNVIPGLREDPGKAEPEQLLQNAQLNAAQQAMITEYQQLHQLQLLQVIQVYLAITCQ